MSSATCAKASKRFRADSIKVIATLGQDLEAYTRRDAETAAITVRLRSHGGECEALNPVLQLVKPPGSDQLPAAEVSCRVCHILMGRSKSCAPVKVQGLGRTL